jgi:hypothetical protein
MLLGWLFIWMLVLCLPFANAQLQLSIPTGLTAFPLQTGMEVPIDIANLAYLDELGVGVGVVLIRIDIRYDSTVLDATDSAEGPVFPTTGWLLSDNPDLAPDVIRIMLEDKSPPDHAITSSSTEGTIVKAVFDVITDDPAMTSNLDFDLIDVVAYDQNLDPIQVDTQGTSGSINIDALKLSIPTGLYSPPWSGKPEDPYPVVQVPINIGNLAYLAELEAQGVLGVSSIRVAIKYDNAVLTATGSGEGSALPNDWEMADNPIWRPDAIQIFVYDFSPPDNLITSGSSEGTIIYAVFDVISTDPTDTSFLNFDLSEAKALDQDLKPVDIITDPIPGDLALPVELSALGAIWHLDGTKIFWEAVSQRGNVGWNIYRSDTKNGKFVKINGELIKGAGTTANPMKYSFIDKDVEKGNIYYYYLEDISFNGGKHRTDAIKSIPVNKITSWGDIKRSALR